MGVLEGEQLLTEITKEEPTTSFLVCVYATFFWLVRIHVHALIVDVTFISKTMTNA